MSYIEQKAKRFTREHLDDPNQLEESALVGAAKTELYDIDSHADRATFLRVILETAASQHAKHKAVCPHGELCALDFAYETVYYYLTQELNRLGIVTDNDQFTPEEKSDYEDKLDNFIEEIRNKWKDDDDKFKLFESEIRDLKNHLILGKKTLRQLALGKVAEMTVSGVVGHSVSLAINTGIKYLDI